VARNQGLATRVPSGLNREAKDARRPGVKLVALEGRGANVTQNPLDVVKFRKTMRRHVLELMQLFALIAMGTAVYIGLTAGSLANVGAATVVAGALLAAGKLFPRALIPVWDVWMKVGWVLEVTTSHLIIWGMWFFVVVPMSLLLRVIGKRVMDLSFHAPVKTYWEDREDKYHDFKLLERQF
jgi:hypothetical protein